MHVTRISFALPHPATRRLPVLRDHLFAKKHGGRSSVWPPGDKAIHCGDPAGGGNRIFGRGRAQKGADTFVRTYHFGHKGSIVVEEDCSTEGGEAAGQSDLCRAPL
jgi:hypothetical protein